MRFIRHLLAQRQLALLLCAATLLLRMLVPTGYMIGEDHGRPILSICSGVMSSASAMTDMAGMHHDDAGHGKSTDHGKAEQPCAFTGLSAAVIDTIDPVQLTALIAFVMAAGFVVLSQAPRVSPRYLTPPLRGPPQNLIVR